MSGKVLIIGACGQIGSELTEALRAKLGSDQVVAADLKEGNPDFVAQGPYVQLDATNYNAVKTTVEQYGIDEVYQLAAILSGNAEKAPLQSWDLNMKSLFNLLELGREKIIKKLFWPSSIAVFGPSTPKENTPQATITEPTTVYGISKLAGERWCSYYFQKYGVDVRSVRYPGLISYKTKPGGGTTDYAIEIFEKALTQATYTCFLKENQALPMMFMDDAIRATIELMEAPGENVKTRSSYNLAGLRITPKELAQKIKQEIPNFKLKTDLDFRQEIAESWPSSIDDSVAQKEWGWEARFNLDQLTESMLKGMNKLHKLP